MGNITETSRFFRGPLFPRVDSTRFHEEIHCDDSFGQEGHADMLVDSQSY